jgi:hypothetical protein
MSKSLIAMIREAASPARATKQMTLELDALSASNRRLEALLTFPQTPSGSPESADLANLIALTLRPDVPLHHTQCFPDRNPPVPIFPPGNSSPGKMAPAFIR